MVNLLLSPLVIAAGWFGFLGWILNRPDSAKRCFRRFAAFGCMFLLVMGWSGLAFIGHRWLWSAFDLAAAACWYSGAARWYGKLEAWRQRERLAAAGWSVPGGKS